MTTPANNIKGTITGDGSGLTGLPDAMTTAFTAGGDVTGSRALDTLYTNGANRKIVIVSVLCAATITAQAQAGAVTVIAGNAVSSSDDVGLPAGVADSGSFQLTTVVDPGAAYQITTSVGVGGAVTLNTWTEADL